LKNFYLNKPFIKIQKPNTYISTNNVINSNNCHISICKTKYKNKFIILSAIDNLIKGGAGQAIQNMNLKFGIKETKGLK
jgi:N-acetyl-gamma-glutamyl-phosphate reductase